MTIQVPDNLTELAQAELIALAIVRKFDNQADRYRFAREVFKLVDLIGDLAD